MSSQLVIVAIRGVLLVGVLAFFAYSLGANVLRDSAATQGPAQGTGIDPGIRVLLLDRSQKTLSVTFGRLQIDLLKPAYLVSPDEPDKTDRQLKIEPGDQLVVRPDVDRFHVSSSTWSDERWPVSRIRLQPRLTRPAAPANPALLDPMRHEAADGDAVFAINGRRYRGCLEIVWKGTKELVAVNVLPLEAYVEGVIAVEMKSSYPIEALKAQAIASRSYAYALQLRARRGKSPFDLTDSLADQEYRGTGLGTAVIETAVRETRGWIMVTARSRRPFEPLFCASSGGFTEAIGAVLPNATDADGRTPIGPLGIMQAQADDFCHRAASALGDLERYWTSTVVLKPRDIKRRLDETLKAHNDDRRVGYVREIRVLEKDPLSQRVQRIAILHTDPQNPTIEMTGHEFRMMIGPHILRSTLWLGEPEKVATENRLYDIKIVCQGYGHGVGMSQISAWAMAKDGWSAKSILAYFYKETELTTW